ncbi:maestro heat-like repeat-containing protein family member 1 [Chrysemys picta bellii]|uniref:maestro heat-like repeat-containing protein family member 1 n=1 Tax=Chrysemys picta bellii TaxID=8478 RepID=UPI0032B294E9
MTVQVRRAAMFLLFELMSMFQAGSGRFWNNYKTEMLLYVEDHKTCFCQREWEQQLLQFLEDLLFFISDHTWLGCFITSIRRQLAYGDKRPGDKSFLYKCWGTVMMFFPAESIKPQLWLLVEMVDFREEEEREGFARALGLCARQQLDEIFAILEHWEEFVSRVQLQPSAGGSLETFLADSPGLACLTLTCIPPFPRTTTTTTFTTTFSGPVQSTVVPVTSLELG